MRVVGVLGSRYLVGRKVGLTALAGLVGMHYNTCQRTMKELGRMEWIEVRNQRNQVYRLNSDGLRIADLLARAEREVRVKVQRVELPRWPRPYIRKVVPAVL